MKSRIFDIKRHFLHIFAFSSFLAPVALGFTVVAMQVKCVVCVNFFNENSEPHVFINFSNEMTTAGVFMYGFFLLFRLLSSLIRLCSRSLKCC